MVKYILVCIVCIITGCTQFAASVSGTFIGNIASDRVLKNIDKKDK